MQVCKIGTTNSLLTWDMLMVCKGQSGSPILRYSNGKPSEVIGTHVRGGMTNTGTAIAGKFGNHYPIYLQVFDKDFKVEKTIGGIEYLSVPSSGPTKSASVNGLGSGGKISSELLPTIKMSGLSLLANMINKVGSYISIAGKAVAVYCVVILDICRPGPVVLPFLMERAKYVKRVLDAAVGAVTQLAVRVLAG